VRARPDPFSEKGIHLAPWTTLDSLYVYRLSSILLSEAVVTEDQQLCGCIRGGELFPGICEQDIVSIEVPLGNQVRRPLKGDHFAEDGTEFLRQRSTKSPAAPSSEGFDWGDGTSIKIPSRLAQLMSMRHP